MDEDLKPYIYKYASPDNVDNIFSRTEKATLKFSLPSEFNDPYELFLTINFKREPEELAFYLDLIGENLQHPTTCFSLSPSVVPMWAHYAQNHSGFVIEFSETKLKASFPEARFGSVKYSDTPTHDLSDLLMRAHQIKKFRYNLWLMSAVFSCAYFTKTLCWSYEQERRMIVDRSDPRVVGDLMLLDVPRDAITSIICGARATDETKAKLKAIAQDIGCRYMELRIGRSSAIPFMVDQSGNPLGFDNGQIDSIEYCCEECREPTVEGVFRCSWCDIDDDVRQRAAMSNSFRILDHYGLLESYLDSAP